MERPAVDINRIRGRGADGVATTINQRARDEIARQTEEYLRQGNKIQVLPNNLGNPARHQFGRAPVIDPLTGQVINHPSREIVDGRMVVRRPYIAFMLRVSLPHVRKIMKRDETFPGPISRRPLTWDEEAVLNWMAANGFEVKK